MVKVVKIMKLSEISSKDIINDEDGARLGKIADVSVHVYRSFKLLHLFGNKDVVQIPWNKIMKIGSDVVIVENSQRTKEDT